MGALSILVASESFALAEGSESTIGSLADLLFFMGALLLFVCVDIFAFIHDV